jgi:hypothetical protein
LTVRATDFPSGISTAANARDPKGLNRRVYREVRESLEAKSSIPGSFDLMNKGITILATSVHLLDKENQVYEVCVDSDEGGIVDGAHTAKIIAEANEDRTTHPDQFVELYIRTGIEQPLTTDIARGLNTGIQVAPKSIYNLEGVFDWLKSELEEEPYYKLFAWKESDNTDYDVRDLIGILEVMNVFDFPNDSGETAGKHPIAAYEKWSVPLEKFEDDFQAHKDNLPQSKYYRLRGLLKGGLILYDHIRRDFREVHNDKGGSAGRMHIVEEASERSPGFDFPFARLPIGRYRLTKGAAYPILAAFRNYVEVGPDQHARWQGGFKRVLKAWRASALELVAETYNATQEIGRMPDQLGKSRRHWDNLHTKIQVRLLRARLSAQVSSAN